MPNKGGALAGLALARTGRGSDECWPWPWYVMKKTGYGQTTYQGKPWLAHRLAFVLAGGVIPDGMTLDHECHTRDKGCPGGICAHRQCVNPAHLAPVTRAENALRGGAPHAQHARLVRCKADLHELAGDNLMISNRPGRAPNRECRACRNIARRAHWGKTHS